MMCIYKITNDINGHSYIGSTLKGFEWRKKKHLRELKSQKHHNRHLQNAYNLYGIIHFQFEVLESVTDPSLLISKEQWWTSKLKPKYNVMKTIKSHIGVKRSKETCHKISSALTGKHLSEETKRKLSQINTGKKQSPETIQKKREKNFKSILQLNKDGKIIRKWKSATEAAIELQINRKTIYACLWGIKRSYKGFLWKKYN